MSNPALAFAAQEALSQATPLRIWMHNLSVDAQGNTIVLSGVTRSRAAKEVAESLVRKVKGVSAVQNQIVVDNDLEVAVAQALAADARTAGAFPGILVGVVFGIVYLKGTVASAEIKSAAGAIAHQIAGVKRVSNELTIG